MYELKAERLANCSILTFKPEPTHELFSPLAGFFPIPPLLYSYAQYWGGAFWLLHKPHPRNMLHANARRTRLDDTQIQGYRHCAISQQNFFISYLKVQHTALLVFLYGDPTYMYLHRCIEL